MSIIGADKSGATLAKFSSQIKGLARPNRFAFSYGTSQTDNFLTFQCTKVSIPKINIKGPEIKWRGTSMTLQGDPKKEPLTVTFLNDSGWEARKYFEKKSNEIRESGSKGNSAHSFSNVGIPFNEIEMNNLTARIEHYGDNNEIIASYEFLHCLPLEISGIDLNMETNGQVETFDVTFYYTKYAQTFPTY